MREPTRFDCGQDPDFGLGMLVREKGEFVYFDDWQNKDDELTDLQFMYDRLVKALGELYKEA